MARRVKLRDLHWPMVLRLEAASMTAAQQRAAEEQVAASVAVAAEETINKMDLGASAKAKDSKSSAKEFAQR